MITVNPCNVLNLLLKHFDDFKATSVVTERERSLSNVIKTLIESTMVSSSPLPSILKYIAHHSSEASSMSNSVIGLSSSPSSSSAYLDSGNFEYKDSPKLKESTGVSTSSFRSNITRTDSLLNHHSKGSPTSTSSTSSGAIIGNKPRPVKPLRKSRVSPVQHGLQSSSQMQQQSNFNHSNSNNTDSSGKQGRLTGSVVSLNRKLSDGNTGHPLLTRGASDLVSSGVTVIPVPIPPTTVNSSVSRFGGMFSMKDNKKSRSMAVLPTSEDKCVSLIGSTPRVSIYTRNFGGSSVASVSSSFRVAKAARQHLISQHSNSASNGGSGGGNSTGENADSGHGNNGGSINGSNSKTGSGKDVTRSPQSYVNSNDKKQPFSYSNANSVTSVANKLNRSGSPLTGKVSSTSHLTSGASSASSSINHSSHHSSSGKMSPHTGSLTSTSAIGSSATLHGTLSSQSTVSTDSMAKKKKIRQRLLLFLRRRPTIETLREKGIFKDEPVFGCNLSNLCAREKTTVPKFVRTIISAIEAKDLKSDGIYRVCGNLSQVQKIRFQVNQDNYTGIWKEDDVHVLTGLLKMFFRDMKDPIFPSSQFDSLMRAISISDRKGRGEAVKKVIDSLVTCNYDTLKCLLQHLLRVKELSDENRMHIQNLAIVFGPTLMWPETEKTATSSGSSSKSNSSHMSNHHNHSSSSNSHSNNSNTKSPSSPSFISSSSNSMTPFSYGNMMNGINGSFANDMLQKIKSNQLVEFLLIEFDLLFTRD